jgi:hypothetical protein
MTMSKKISQTSKNTNCLEAVKCPNCGQEDIFKIGASVIVEVSDHGTEDQGGDYEWDQAAFCQCCDCDHTGRLADFTIENWDKKKAKKKAEQAPDLDRLHGALMASHDLFYKAQTGDSGDREHDAAMDLYAAVDNFNAAYLTLRDAAEVAQSQMLQASRLFHDDKEYQKALQNLTEVLGY